MHLQMNVPLDKALIKAPCNMFSFQNLSYKGRFTQLEVWKSTSKQAIRIYHQHWLDGKNTNDIICL